MTIDRIQYDVLRNAVIIYNRDYSYPSVNILIPDYTIGNLPQFYDMSDNLVEMEVLLEVEDTEIDDYEELKKFTDSINNVFPIVSALQLCDKVKWIDYADANLNFNFEEYVTFIDSQTARLTNAMIEGNYREIKKFISERPF